MKKLFAIISIFMIISSVNALDFSFGIEGAVGLNTMKEESSGVESDFDFIPGFRFGNTAELSFNEVTSLEAKVLFHNENGFSYISPLGKSKTSFWTVDIPLIVKLTFAGIYTIPGKFSMFAGPTFNFLISDIEESLSGRKLEKSSLSLNPFVLGIEAGCEYDFTKSKGFNIGFSVNCDLTDFSNTTGIVANRICIMPYFGYKF